MHSIIEHISQLTMVQFIFCLYVIKICEKLIFEIFIRISPARKVMLVRSSRLARRISIMEIEAMGYGGDTPGTFEIDCDGNITKKEDK